jgi:hypothetical protein
MMQRTKRKKKSKSPKVSSKKRGKLRNPTLKTKLLRSNSPK